MKILTDPEYRSTAMAAAALSLAPVGQTPQVIGTGAPTFSEQPHDDSKNHLFNRITESYALHDAFTSGTSMNFARFEQPIADQGLMTTGITLKTVSRDARYKDQVEENLWIYPQIRGVKEKDIHKAGNVQRVVHHQLSITTPTNDEHLASNTKTIYTTESGNLSGKLILMGPWDVLNKEIPIRGHIVTTNNKGYCNIVVQDRSLVITIGNWRSMAKAEFSLKDIMDPTVADFGVFDSAKQGWDVFYQKMHPSVIDGEKTKISFVTPPKSYSEVLRLIPEKILKEFPQLYQPIEFEKIYEIYRICMIFYSDISDFRYRCFMLNSHSSRMRELNESEHTQFTRYFFDYIICSSLFTLFITVRLL